MNEYEDFNIEGLIGGPKAAKHIYVYEVTDEGLVFYSEYRSINDSVHSLRIPKTTIVKAVDTYQYDQDNKTRKSKRIYSQTWDKTFIVRTKPIEHLHE